MELYIKEHEEQSSKKVVAVQLSLEMYNILKEEAREEFISVSDVLRRIIIKHYDSEIDSESDKK